MKSPAAARNLNPPFPFPPPGASRGGEGSPHAAKTRRLPPQEGIQSAPLNPPLCIPPLLAHGVHPNGVYVHPIPMEDRELYRRILGIESPWIVASVDLQLASKEVHIHLTHADLPTWPCAECATPSKLYDHQPERQW